MGLDCNYQVIPNKPELFERARADSEFAEDVFYPLIRYGSWLEDQYYFSEPEFECIRDLFEEFPYIKQCNFKPTSRMHDALTYTLDPEAYERAQSSNHIERTFFDRFVNGDRQFSRHFRLGSARVMEGAFIRECVEYGISISHRMIIENYNPAKMEKLGVYKIWSGANRENQVLEYFVGLFELYKKADALGNCLIFVTKE